MRLKTTAGFALMLSLLSACQPALNWREARPAGAGVVALFPCKPETEQRPAQGQQGAMGLAQCEAAGKRFALSWADAPDPTQAGAALKAMPQALAAKLGQALPAGEVLQVPGMTPLPEAAHYRIAGAGGVGIAVGFGSQRLVQDVITGIFLLLEDAVAVGDVVQLGGLNGVVEHLSIRSIKLRAVDGSLHIIPFSTVTSVTNQTRDFAFAVIDVNVDYGEDTDKVAEALRDIAAEMRQDPRWRPVIRDDLDVMGVDKLGDSGVVMRVRLKTEPSQRWAVAREMNRRIKRRFDELGIEIPYPHQKLVLEDKHPALTAGVAQEPPAASA
jgi:hypothetical protein